MKKLEELKTKVYKHPKYGVCKITDLELNKKWVLTVKLTRDLTKERFSINTYETLEEFLAEAKEV
jgi:hypothetical protein